MFLAFAATLTALLVSIGEPDKIVDPQHLVNVPSQQDEPHRLPPSNIVYPQHLIDIKWKTNATETVNNVMIDILINDDIPESYNVFIAPMSGNLIYSEPFYLGIGARLPEVYESRTDAFFLNRKVVSKGKGVVFSRWNTLDLENIKLPANSYYFAANYEGEYYVSSRSLFKWRKGRYTFRVERAQFGNDVAESQNKSVWYNAYIFEHSSGNIHYCGSIRYTKDEISSVKKRYTAGNCFYSFVECFNDGTFKDTIGHFSVQFGPLHVNGVACGHDKVMLRYNASTYEYAYVEKQNEFIVVDIDPARNAIHTQQRVVPLIKP